MTWGSVEEKERFKLDCLPELENLVMLWKMGRAVLIPTDRYDKYQKQDTKGATMDRKGVGIRQKGVHEGNSTELGCLCAELGYLEDME